MSAALRKRSTERPAAHVRALRWLTRREYSLLELRSRLEAEGYTSAEIQEAVEWLSEGQWQSDERFAGSLARRRSGAFGSRLIRAELQRHHIEEPAIATAIESLAQSDADRAFAWLEKRSRGHALTVENRARWYRALMARGFRPDDIHASLKRLSEHLGQSWTNSRFDDVDTGAAWGFSGAGETVNDV